MSGGTCKGGSGLAAMGVFWRKEVHEGVRVEEGMGMAENPVDPEGRAQEKKPGD